MGRAGVDINKVDIKPLSVNQAWQGRRFKTPKYKKYESDTLMILPKIKIPEGKLEIHYKFYFSSKLSDIDNPVKPFQDILCKKYGIDDRDIYRMSIEKHIVKKGCDCIEFEIMEFLECFT